ncbi:serine hydrolase [Methylocystis heyeri]|uniref:beta-lactamase n=1 Tax=Methylocystis heyeri TaxID=391905 RepID=A0A6B8KC02_9HYPH|nr:serine hydrolase [Methylocystis heyeri]QGM45726.1 hypothetical protein H2LOC_008435 [Methylocystis heyeri]
MERRSFLALAAASLASPSFEASAQPAAVGSSGIEDAIAEFLRLPGSKSFLIRSARQCARVDRSYNPDHQMFVGSAVKTFILAEFLRRVEAGELSENQQIPIDDGIRSLDSPVFLNLTGSTRAADVLEAMISHSDNTATDAAMAAAGVANVRQFIASAGLTQTIVPDSTRIMFSYLAGAPYGVDMGWAGMQQIAAGHYFGPLRSPLNMQETMMSTASEMVSYYQRALSGQFFTQKTTLSEFRRIQATADAIARIVPDGVKGYAKGGSINWDPFHALCVPGQMVVNNEPITFCFTLNWIGAEADVQARFGAALAKILGYAAQMC